MEDIFKPQSLTIKALLGNQDALYQIPRYQRPYSWGDEQIDKLWEDLRDAQANNEINYFLGSIITARSPENKNYLDIVDGQQRLTTLIILLCVCRDLYPNINQKVLTDDPFAIDGNTIKNSIKYNDRLERLRLMTHSNHASDFQKNVLDESKAIKNDKPLKKDLKKEEEPTFKFQNTAAFYTEKFKEIGEEETGKFINYLFNNVKVIRIDCQSVNFAIKLFQVLNDRGLDLSAADLIKSFLISQIHKKYQNDESLKQQKENQFMDDWKACERIAIDTEESINNLFIMYEYYRKGKNPEKSVSDELEDLLKNEDANDVMCDFKSFVTCYKEHIYDKDDALIYSFYYLRWSMYWKSILLTSLHTSYKEHDQLIKLLRRYYYINWIAGFTLTKIKQTSFNLIAWIKNKKTIAEIEQELQKGLNTDILDRATKNLNEEIYSEAWCKPLLFMIEYNQTDNTTTPSFLDMTDRNIQIEHIIPKKHENNKDWQYVDQINDVNDWIHTGANLTLLSGRKNSEASNNSFDKKILTYKGIGNKNGKITSFKISQKIVEDYNSDKFNKRWDIDAINDRWIWFCEQIEEVLDIDLSKNKIKEISKNV